MKPSEIIKYYSKEGVKKAIIGFSKNKEVIPKFKDGGFGKRPCILNYEQEIVDLIRRGATSFHVSEERWLQPMLLKSEMNKKEMDKIRTGWDFIIDIDCPILDYSKICADILRQALEFHDIESASIKFSGGTGFHIGIPFEAFPNIVNGKPLKEQFPDIAKVIANYLKDMIKDSLRASLLEKEPFKIICKRIGKSEKDVTVNDILDPFRIVEIDSQLISSRHLFRTPYSLNEKTWLASIPIEFNDIVNFTTRYAEPRRVKVVKGFLDKEPKENDGEKLLKQALDWNSRKNTAIEERYGQKAVRAVSKRSELGKIKIDKEFFPPCIIKMANGLEDGRKRSLFVLINFLGLMNWEWDEIVKQVMDWNSKNNDPLRESLVKSQLSYYKKRKGYMPPNCDNIGFYVDIGLCTPDGTCKRIKNPINYPYLKYRGKINGRRNKLSRTEKNTK